MFKYTTQQAKKKSSLAVWTLRLHVLCIQEDDTSNAILCSNILEIKFDEMPKFVGYSNLLHTTRTVLEYIKANVYTLMSTLLFTLYEHATQNMQEIRHYHCIYILLSHSSKFHSKNMSISFKNAVSAYSSFYQMLYIFFV